MPEPPQTDAVAQTVAFVVATSFFLGIIGSVFVATSEPPDGDDAQDATHRLEAQRLADLLTGSPGVGWEDGPDAVHRLGLLHADGGRLDPARLDALRGASLLSLPDNGLLDYPDALAGLGLPTDGSAGVHVRVAPVGLRHTLLNVDLSHLRVAYLGDWDDISGGVMVPLGTEAEMEQQARAELDAAMAPDTAAERQVLAGLGIGFDDLVHMDGIGVSVDLGLGVTVGMDTLIPPERMEGDVYPDSKDYLDSVVPSRLPDYDVLVVGSMVSHNSLTSDAVKLTVRDWVLAGGTLLVFGSGSSNFQWLQPLFHVGTSTANGAPLVFDVSHPMLNEPFGLDWTAYDDHDLVWDLPKTGDNAIHGDFQHVITAGDGDVLAVSNEGVFGNGSVFLTTYRPGEIAADLSEGEASGFVHNIVLYSDRSHLYLDYGPTPPDGAAVSSAVRTMQMHDELLGMVNVRVTVLYWGL